MSCEITKIPGLFLLILLSFASPGLTLSQTVASLRADLHRHFEEGNYKAALKDCEEALQLAKSQFGEQHTEYANAYFEKGEILHQLGNTTEAKQYLLDGLRLVRIADGEVSGNYASSLISIANYFLQTRQPKTAEKYLLDALTPTIKVYGKESDRYTDFLSVMGTMYVSMQAYEDALVYFKENIILREKIFSKNHLRYAEAAGNLGYTYTYLQNYVQAQPLLEEAHSLRKKLIGENSLFYWYSLNNLAAFYSETGNHARAIQLNNEVVQRMHTEFSNHELYFSSINSLIQDYRYVRNFAVADSLISVALPLSAKNFGPKSTVHAVLLHNKANLLEYWHHDFQSAEANYREAISIYESQGIFPKSMINNLAGLYSKQRKFAKSDSLFVKLLNAYSTESIISLNSIIAQNNFAISQFKQKKFDESSTILNRINIFLHDNLLSNFIFFTEKQKLEYKEKWRNIFDSYCDIASTVRNSTMNKILYQAVINQKNLILDEQSSEFKQFNTSKDTVVKHYFLDLKQVRQQLANKNPISISAKSAIDSLKSEAEIIERNLLKKSAIFRRNQQRLQTNWKQIQYTLKINEAAIEFINYRFNPDQQQSDSIIYAALLLRPGWPAPRLIPLTDEKTLAALLRQPADGQAIASTELLRARAQTLTNTGQLTQGEALYRLIWQPLDSLLRGVRQVWVSPSGLLHQVSLAALPYPNTAPTAKPGYLSDRYVLRLVGSTRTVATRSATPPKPARTALLYGGVEYGTTSAEGWPALPGTGQEVASIGVTWGKLATVVTGRNATKAHLMAATATPPDVLHLATHGFFRSGSDQRTDFVRASADPVLTRSGVVLAGANAPTTDSLNHDNGILTGLEFANLNLSGTELVVLSACETGLGDIRGSEGVFGLQRAVKMAGARNLLLSLWPVPDGPTSQFMTAFYQNWRGKKSLSAAFAQTQRSFRQRYPPAVWAAFVLIE